MSKRSTHEQQTGWRYYGSFAAALCKGPVDVLHEILMEDQVIFRGPVTRDSADGNGMTELETELGTIRFYWGTDDQAQDARILERAAPVSAYRGVCYYVADHILWGDDRGNPPHLTFDLERAVDLLPLAEHTSEGDVNPVEALYAFLRDAAEGPGLAAGDFDLPSWEAAAATLAAEEIWCSVEIDDRHSGRDIIARHLELIRGRLIESGDKIGIQLDRPSGSYLAIGAEDLLEEPDVEPGDLADIFSEIFLKYRNRDTRDEEAIEGYVDEVTTRMIGRARRLDIDMHWVRQRDVARRLAAREGYLAAASQRTGHLVLRPTAAVAAGDRVLLTYDKGGIEGLRCVVTDVARRADSVQVEIAEDIAIDPLTLAIPDAPHLHEDEEPVDLQEFYAYAHVVPRPFQEGGDGVFFAISQPHWRVTEVNVLTDVTRTAQQHATRDLWRSFFPAACQLLWLTPAPPEIEDGLPASESLWIARIKARKAADADQLLRLWGDDTEEERTIYGIAQEARGNTLGYLHVLEVEPDGYKEMIAPGTWDVLVRSVSRDSYDYGDVPAMPQLRQASAESPDEIGISDGLMVGTWDSFTFRRNRHEGWRYREMLFRFKLRFFVGAQAGEWIEEWKDEDNQLHPFSFDSTRDAKGNRTPSPTWGKPAAFLTEKFNSESGKTILEDPTADMTGLEDVDAALGRLVEGTDTEADEKWAGLDEALGRCYETGYYG